MEFILSPTEGLGTGHSMSRRGCFSDCLLVPHFWSPGIGSFGNERNSQDLVAMVAGDTPGILIRILDVLFIDPKKLFTFRAFFNKFRHSDILSGAGIS